MLYAIITHILYTKNGENNYGPAHYIFDYLKKEKKEVIIIKHCLEGNNTSVVEDSNGQIKKKNITNKFLFLRYLFENLYNLKILSGCKKEYKSDKVLLICIDPLNALSGAILKFLGLIDKFIYFTVDYADQRFNNLFLNFVYHALDRIALFEADEIWCVSTRIILKRKEQGVKIYKIKFLPNSPNSFKVPKDKNLFQKDLIIVSHLTKSLDLRSILNVINNLKNQYKEIRLIIVGTGPEENNFKSMVKKMNLSKKVIFVGQKSHEEAMGLINNSFIGFALYTTKNSWNKYGDSMKAREYVSLGIPVVINSVPSTADDIRRYNAGLVIDSLDVDVITSFIEKCVDNSKYYNLLVKNAMKMGRDFDKNKILDSLFVY